MISIHVLHKVQKGKQNQGVKYEIYRGKEKKKINRRDIIYNKKINNCNTFEKYNV